MQFILLIFPSLMWILLDTWKNHWSYEKHGFIPVSTEELTFIYLSGSQIWLHIKICWQIKELKKKSVA